MSAILAKGCTVESLRAFASQFDPPSWATHTAVRFDGSRVEPAYWSHREQAYLDEDPAALDIGAWAGAFKEAYWHFFPVAKRNVPKGP